MYFEYVSPGSSSTTTTGAAPFSEALDGAGAAAGPWAAAPQAMALRKPSPFFSFN